MSETFRLRIYKKLPNILPHHVLDSFFFQPQKTKKKPTQEVQRLQMELAARFLFFLQSFWRWFWKGGERREQREQKMRFKDNMTGSRDLGEVGWGAWKNPPGRFRSI